MKDLREETKRGGVGKLPYTGQFLAGRLQLTVEDWEGWLAGVHGVTAGGNETRDSTTALEVAVAVGLGLESGVVDTVGGAVGSVGHGC